MKVHAARSSANDPLQKCKYRVTITGLPTGIGFSKVSGLKREINTVEYVEGGYEHTHKIKGKEKVDPITLERGMFATKDLQNLYLSSLKDRDSRVTVAIELMDKFDTVQRTWTLGEAWVKSWEGTDLDASSDDISVEKLTLEFEYYID